MMRSQRRGAEGFTAVELLVAMLLLGIVLSATLVTVASMEQATASTLRRGNAAEGVDVGVADVVKYLQGAVSPLAAAASLREPPQAQAPCWGTSLGSTMEESALLVGAPFDVMFCGFPLAKQGYAAPHLYEIGVEPNSCVNSACTLAVFDCGGLWSSDLAPSSLPSFIHPSLCARPGGVGRVVWSVHRVWCDTNCQNGTPGSDPSATPPFFSYSASATSGFSGPQPLGLFNKADQADSEALASLRVVDVDVRVLANIRQDPSAGTEIHEQVILGFAPGALGGYAQALSSLVASVVPARLQSAWHFWPLDDPPPPAGEAGVAHDASGNAVNGSFLPGPSGVTAGVFDPPFESEVPATVMSLSGGWFGSIDMPQDLPYANPGIPGLTVMAWFKLPGGTSFSDHPRIIADDHTDCTGRGFQLVLNPPGQLGGFFDVGLGSRQPTCGGSGAGEVSWTGPTSLADGNWHFYVGTYNGTDVSAYLDGELVGTSTVPNGGSVQPPAPNSCDNGQSCVIEIGADPAEYAPTDEFPGELADVAIIPAGLTAAQVEALDQASGNLSSCVASAISADGPSAFWPLVGVDGVAGDSIAIPSVVGGTDLAPFGDFQLSSSPGPPSCGQAGPSATSFSYMDRLLPVAGAVATSPTTMFEQDQLSPGFSMQPFSIVAFFKTSWLGTIVSFGSDSNPDHRSASTSDDRHLYVGTDGRLHFGVWAPSPGSSSPAQQIVSSPSTVTDGKWHLAVATLGPAGEQLYLDGSLVGSSPVDEAQAYTGYWYVGGFSTECSPWEYVSSCLQGQQWVPNNFPFVGAIADVAIFNVALSGQQVAALWLASKGA